MDALLAIAMIVAVATAVAIGLVAVAARRLAAPPKPFDVDEAERTLRAWRSALVASSLTIIFAPPVALGFLYSAWRAGRDVWRMLPSVVVALVGVGLPIILWAVPIGLRSVTSYAPPVFALAIIGPYVGWCAAPLIVWLTTRHALRP